MEAPCPRCGCAALDDSPATFVVCRVCGETYPATGRRANAGLTLADRLATGAMSLLLALAAVLMVLAFAIGRTRLEEFMFMPVFGWFAALFLVAAPIAGFWLGSERAASAWGALWGTERPRRRQLLVTVAFLMIVTLLALLA